MRLRKPERSSRSWWPGHFPLLMQFAWLVAAFSFGWSVGSCDNRKDPPGNKTKILGFGWGSFESLLYLKIQNSILNASDADEGGLDWCKHVSRWRQRKLTQICDFEALHLYQCSGRPSGIAYPLQPNLQQPSFMAGFAPTVETQASTKKPSALPNAKQCYAARRCVSGRLVLGALLKFPSYFLMLLLRIPTYALVAEGCSGKEWIRKPIVPSMWRIPSKQPCCTVGERLLRHFAVWVALVWLSSCGRGDESLKPSC